MTVYLFWSPEQETLLRKCAADGLTMTETSRVLGISPKATCSKAKRDGIKWKAHKHQPGQYWTDERVEIVRQLYVTKGLSARQIAMHLADGTTRNAVISILHRRGIILTPEQMDARQGAAYRPATRITAEPRRAPAPKMQPIKSLAEPISASLGALDHQPHHCKWPTNNGRPEWLWCAADRMPGRPYCAHHWALGHTEGRPMRVRYG